jgi:hypothetical protein
MLTHISDAVQDINFDLSRSYSIDDQGRQYPLKGFSLGCCHHSQMDRVETKMPLAIDFELDKVNAQAKYVTVLYFASRHSGQ